MSIGQKMIKAAAWLTLKPNEWARKLPKHTASRFFAELGSLVLAVLAWPLSIPLLLLGVLVASLENLLGIGD